MDPTTTSTAVATQKAPAPLTVRSVLADAKYKKVFEDTLGKRAPQFMSSVISLSHSFALRDAEPKSVVAAAMVAATLDLPVNPTLGFAHVVAYRDNRNGGVKVAQFQIGYKGIIQLALRSAQYRRMNADGVNKEVFGGYDPIGEPKLDWSKFDPLKEVAGYFAGWELVNGFIKTVYWPKEQVEAHAERFSQAFRAKKKDSPWFSDFDSMATKTVLKNALAKWGILSVELQQAIENDQGVRRDIDADPEFLDNEAEALPEVRKPIFGDDKPATEGPAGGATHPDLEAGEPPVDVKATEPLPDREPLIAHMKEQMLDQDVSESKLFKYAQTLKIVPEGIDELWALPTGELSKLSKAIPALSTKKAKK